MMFASMHSDHSIVSMNTSMPSWFDGLISSARSAFASCGSTAFSSMNRERRAPCDSVLKRGLIDAMNSRASGSEGREFT